MHVYTLQKTHHRLLLWQKRTSRWKTKDGPYMISSKMKNKPAHVIMFLWTPPHDQDDQDNIRMMEAPERSLAQKLQSKVSPETGGCVALAVVCGSEFYQVPLQQAVLRFYTHSILIFGLLNINHAVVGYWMLLTFVFFSDLLLLAFEFDMSSATAWAFYTHSVIWCHFHMLAQAGFPWPIVWQPKKCQG